MKLDINNRRKDGKSTNMWKLNNILLDNQWVKEEIKRKVKNTLRHENVTYQHLWDVAKAVLRGKFVVINAYFKK